MPRSDLTRENVASHLQVSADAGCCAASRLSCASIVCHPQQGQTLHAYGTLQRLHGGTIVAPFVRCHAECSYVAPRLHQAVRPTGKGRDEQVTVFLPLPGSPPCDAQDQSAGGRCLCCGEYTCQSTAVNKTFQRLMMLLLLCVLPALHPAPAGCLRSHDPHGIWRS